MKRWVSRFARASEAERIALLDGIESRDDRERFTALTDLIALFCERWRLSPLVFYALAPSGVYSATPDDDEKLVELLERQLFLARVRLGLAAAESEVCEECGQVHDDDELDELPHDMPVVERGV